MAASALLCDLAEFLNFLPQWFVVVEQKRQEKTHCEQTKQRHEEQSRCNFVILVVEVVVHHICNEEQDKNVKVIFANSAAQQHFVELAVVRPHFEGLQQAIPNEDVEHQIQDIYD
jgi:hypothetical protein